MFADDIAIQAPKNSVEAIHNLQRANDKITKKNLGSMCVAKFMI